MTKTEGRTAAGAVKEILLSSPDGLREVIRTVLQEVLEAEMDEALGAAKGERTPERLGYRSGHYGRTLITPGLSVISCVAGDCILRRHGADEAFAEDDSELRLSHGPLTWRHFPLFL